MSGEERGVTRRQFLGIVGAGIVGLTVGFLAGRQAAPVREVVRTETVTATETTTTTATVTTTSPVTVTETETVTQTRVVEKPVPVVKRYERVRLANVRDLRVGQPLIREYMGKPVIVLKLGEPALGGVGPDRDIVAFSSLCTHMGGGLVYDRRTRTLICPVHYSQFDPARGGMVVVGHATEYLPQLALEYDERTGDIYAVGFLRLVYGVESNL